MYLDRRFLFVDRNQGLSSIRVWVRHYSGKPSGLLVKSFRRSRW